MVFDPLTLGLLGGLLGGGTTQTTTVSTTASNQLAITPNSVINIGGGVTSNPLGGGVTGDPNSNAQAQVVPEGQQSGFAFGAPQTGQISSLAPLPFGAGGSSFTDLLSDPFILAAGGALIFFLATSKKGK